MFSRHDDSHSPHIWIGAGLIGLFIALVSFLSPQVRNERTPMGADDVAYSYEMARIEPEEGPFDLSGRDVQRRKRELEALAQKKAAALAGPKAGTGALKKAAHAAKPKTKPVSIKSAAAAMARAQMDVNTISESDRFRMKSGLGGAANLGAQPAVPYSYAVAQPAKPSASTPQEPKPDEPKLTPEQWRSLLQVSPTAANVAKLIVARGKGDIDDGTVLEITKDLLRDSGDDRQKAGLMILDRTTSASAFEFMVREKAIFSSNIQTELQKKIESYALPARLVYLGPVLSSTSEDRSAVGVALELIEVAVTEYKRLASGQITQSTGAPSLAQLQIFLSTLRRVGEQGETTIAQQALALSQDIQDLKPITVKSGTTGRPTQTARIQ